MPGRSMCVVGAWGRAKTKVKNMERRKFLIGMGTIATGSAVAVGTGAFSQATVPDRQLTVEVAENDGDGGVGLIPGDTDIAYYNGDGELEINLNEGLRESATGMNPNSTYYLGGTKETLSWNNGQSGYNWEEGVDSDEFGEEDLDRPLFSIRNQSTEERRTKITLELVEAPEDFEMVALGYQYGDVETNGSAITVDGDNPTASGTGLNLSPGHEYNVVMVLKSGSDSGTVKANITVDSYAMRPEYEPEPAE